MKMKKKVLSLAAALACAASLAVPAFADDTTVSADGGQATTALTIEAAATQLNVTIPTALHISVDNNGNAAVGQGAITNHSTGIVEVKGVTLKSGEYNIIGFNSSGLTAARQDFQTYDVGSRQIGLSMSFGGDTDELTGTAVNYKTTGSYDVSNKTNSTYTTMDGASLTGTVTAGTMKVAASGNSAGNANTLKIVTEAAVSPTGATAVAADTVAANMIITIGWYTGA